MYTPLQPGIPNKFKQAVLYEEVYPGSESPVYCFWSLQTPSKLKEDFCYLVLPDGCIDLVFDISQSPSFGGALIMTPNVTAERLNLGTSFSYVGIRLRPGAWLASPYDIVGQAIPTDNLAGHDLHITRRQLTTVAPVERAAVLQKLVSKLEQSGILSDNIEAPVHCQTVKDYISKWSCSRRHVQRVFRNRLGYTPHDFIKITRFQQSLRQGSFEAYADQSHYNREFKRITSLTPREFQAMYC